jgi:hypothetical protein
MKWIAIDGEFNFGKKIVFHGKPANWTTPQGEERTGLGVGIAMSDQFFSGGQISADIQLGHVTTHNGCEIVFYYDTATRAHVCAGIGGLNSAFIIRDWDGSRWNDYAMSGLRSSLEANKVYKLTVTVLGSRVKLFVDGVEVAQAVLPFALRPSQVGIFALDDNDLSVSNYSVETQKGKVFVVMQFGSPFNEIHEDVIKEICSEFGLEAKRADETFGPGMIIADVTREIAESEFVVAEITPANPNVYYELGYAHAIRKPTILLADRGMDRLPFDVSPFRVLFYENSIAGKKLFEEGLRKHVAAILSSGTVGRVHVGK